LNNNKFDDIIRPYVKNRINFCSIDIDGLDLEIFKSINIFLPDVVCIEGGQMLVPFHDEIPLKKSVNNIQQSLSIYINEFNKKGYKLICSYQDCFFIKEEYFDKFNVSTNLYTHYFNGLIASYHRLPWILKTIKKHNLNNEIIENILNNVKNITNKKQAKQNKDKLIKYIKYYRNNYKN
jgi:hypothetical protein